MNIIEFVNTYKHNLTYKLLNDFIQNNPNNLNCVDYLNNNVLIYALYEYIYNIEIIELLLKNGVYVDSNSILSNIKRIDYYFAYTDTIKLLIKYGFNLHKFFLFNDLCNVFDYNNLVFLINNGADVNVDTNIVCNIFVNLTKQKQYKYIKLLIKNNININNIKKSNVKTIFDNTIHLIYRHPISYLHLVLYKNNNVLDLLIDNGLNLDASKIIFDIYTKDKKIILQEYYFKYSKII